MYMDYSKLWKLLIDCGLKKTDLLALAGISSRVLAKLSKNETVTTDTVARICAALNCDVSDVMECVSDASLSVYAAYKKLGVCKEKNDLFKTVCFTRNGKRYTVFESRQSANKATHILCREDGTVYWEQNEAVGHIRLEPTVRVLVKPPRTEEAVIIVLIKGKPAVISGLDENGFVSSRGIRKKSTDVYVMSEAAMKLFSLETDVH